MIGSVFYNLTHGEQESVNKKKGKYGYVRRVILYDYWAENVIGSDVTMVLYVSLLLM